MKFKLVGVLALVIAAFLAGFVPQYQKVNSVEKEAASLREDLRISRHEAQMGDFRNRLALLQGEANKSNYASAGELATGLFTEMRSYANGLPDGDDRKQIESVLAARDSIIAGLAKADPTTSPQIYDLFIKLQAQRNLRGR
ncbi:MAG: hypothetical protein IT168_26165 [Bryobacterales bacterium]|nr:hypothetical protein [Bryobacterales bacterium]